MVALLVIFIAAVLGIVIIYQIFLSEKYNSAKVPESLREYSENPSKIFYEEQLQDVRTELKLRRDFNALKARWEEQLQETRRQLAEKEKVIESLQSPSAEVARDVVSLPPDLISELATSLPMEDRQNTISIHPMPSERAVIEHLTGRKQQGG